MTDGLLGIGAFSRASLLSIKQLRAYHEAGLLVPAAVDSETGYRSYHWSQLTDAAVIRRLRAVDLPLDQVRQVVQARDPAVTRRVLARQRVALQSRLEELTRALDTLHEAVDRPALHTPVHVRTVDATPVLALSGKVREADLAAFLDTAYQRLGAAVERLGVAPSGPTGGLYPHEIADDVEAVTAFVPLAAPPHVGHALGDGGVTAGRLPAATVAVAAHVGPYETLDASYRLLGAWVAQHATPAPLPVREIYLVSYDQTSDPDRFRTEIHWPIAESSPSAPAETASA